MKRRKYTIIEHIYIGPFDYPQVIAFCRKRYTKKELKEEAKKNPSFYFSIPGWPEIRFLPNGALYFEKDSEKLSPFNCRLAPWDGREKKSW